MLIQGDALTELKKLPNDSVDCCVTSPPYYQLRDYGVEGQIGLEETVEDYIAKLVEVFREVRRVLKKDGTLWLNIADSYAGSGKGAAKYPSNAMKYKQGNKDCDKRTKTHHNDPKNSDTYLFNRKYLKSPSGDQSVKRLQLCNKSIII